MGHQVRVNPWYGWGYDTDLVTGKVGLWNLCPKVVQARMQCFGRVTGDQGGWNYGDWRKTPAAGGLRNSFINDYAHKKRAQWDLATRAFYVRTRKAGVETRLEFPPAITFGEEPPF